MTLTNDLQELIKWPPILSGLKRIIVCAGVWVTLLAQSKEVKTIES